MSDTVLGRLALVLCAIAGVAGASSQHATSQPAGGEYGSDVPTSQSALADREPSLVPGPAYGTLRYNDDFSYLDGPAGSYKEDFFDPIKRMKLGDGVTLRLGGEVRGRFESVTHKRYGVDRDTQDAYFLHRYLLHGDVQYRSLARLYIEGISAFLEDNDSVTPGTSEDRLDMQQLFADLRILGEDIPLTLRFGRQDMNYGKGRMVEASNWSNVRRNFDGVKLFWSDDLWNVDAWFVKPVEKRQRDVDNAEWDQDFFGLYTTYKGLENHRIDAYFLALVNQGLVTNANLRTGDIGDLAVYTLGGRVAGKKPLDKHIWDYEAEAAYQWGKFSADTIRAWTVALETGYTLENVGGKPRIALGLDYASGDSNPFDDMHETFVPQPGASHGVFGWIDQIGRANVWDPYIALALKPAKQWEAKVYFHSFWADHNRDALYDTSGRPVRRSPFGGIGNHFGNELDLVLEWKVDAHTSMMFGYSHFWPGNFIEQTGRSEDPDLLYVQYRVQF